jgi:hypothetical protein
MAPTKADRTGVAIDPDDDLVCTGGFNAGSPIACRAGAPLALPCRRSYGNLTIQWLGHKLTEAGSRRSKHRFGRRCRDAVFIA